jgi:uncharacterized protein
MQTNLLWTGQGCNSLENCLLTTTKTGSEINSVIIGMSDSKIYRIEYRIKTNLNWETVFAEIKSQLEDTIVFLSFQSDGKGNWTTNGKPAEQFNGCIDVDISLTPFTNTLPINRLTLAENEQQQIMVVYFDLLEQQIKPVRQKYTRLSKNKYKYENVPNDYEAIIEVDELGLVVHYPGLFLRVGRRESNYR